MIQNLCHYITVTYEDFKFKLCLRCLECGLLMGYLMIRQIMHVELIWSLYNFYILKWNQWKNQKFLYHHYLECFILYKYVFKFLKMSSYLFSMTRDILISTPCNEDCSRNGVDIFQVKRVIAGQVDQGFGIKVLFLLSIFVQDDRRNLTESVKCLPPLSTPD